MDIKTLVPKRGRPRQPICPRCKLEEKKAGQSYCHGCHSIRRKERRASFPVSRKKNTAPDPDQGAENVRLALASGVLQPNVD